MVDKPGDINTHRLLQIGDIFQWWGHGDWNLVTSVKGNSFSIFRDWDKEKVEAKKQELGI